MDVKDIGALLDKYPEIKQRLKEMLDIVEGPNRGEFNKADAMEEKILGVSRNLNQSILQNWATEQSKQANVQIEKRMPSAKKNIKKKFIDKRSSEE